MLGLLLKAVADFPWNNHLHLKVFSIFEELLESASNSAEMKAAILNDNDVCEQLATMADEPDFKFESGRQVRHGYMAFVVKLANLVLKRVEMDQLDTLCKA